MPKEFSRTQRIAGLIQRELATLIQRELKDPRLDMITISAVNVTRDLAYAKIYVTVMSEEKNIKQNLQLLNKASGFLRKALSHKIEIRTMPQLTFVYDKSIIEGQRISALIDTAIAEDKKNIKG